MRILLELGAWHRARESDRHRLLVELGRVLTTWNRALVRDGVVPDAIPVEYVDPAGPLGTPDRWGDAWIIAADGRGDCIELVAIWAARRPSGDVMIQSTDEPDAWHAIGTDRATDAIYEPHSGVV